jgi:hypothetical protein
MNDWAQTLIAKSDQINNPDLASGPLVITITGVKLHPNDAQKASISFAGSDKVFRPCLGMRRIMSLVWATDKKDDFIGRSMQLYRDPEVNYGTNNTGGIRISHMSHIDKPQTHTVPIRRGVYKTYTIMPLILSASGDVAPIDVDAIKASAIAAYRNGKEAFTEWWNANKNAHHVVKPMMDDIRKEAAKADESNDEGI